MYFEFLFQMKCNFIRFKGPRRYRWYSAQIIKLLKNPYVGKLTRWHQSDSHPTLSCPLTPCSANSDFARLCNSWGHIAQCLHVMRCSLGHRLLCLGSIHKLQLKSPGGCCIEATLEEHHGYVIWGYGTAALWLCYGFVWLLPRLLHQPGERLCYGCRASQERINVLLFLRLASLLPAS